MAAFRFLFEPIRIGDMEIPNRICHVPTDISSSHVNGEVSSRDIYHHETIARGGTGLIVVGATSPNHLTNRSTVTNLVADDDTYIPGLARLAAAMHRYGAKCAAQLQHRRPAGVPSPRRQAGVQRRGGEPAVVPEPRNRLRERGREGEDGACPDHRRGHSKSWRSFARRRGASCRPVSMRWSCTRPTGTSSPSS